MNEIAIKENGAASISRCLDQEYFERWVAYVDAAPKTIETYQRAIRQFVYFLAENGISKPCREDVVAYREAIKLNHKPTTVQGYMAAVKLFFQWTANEGLYPNIAERVKGAKLDPEHKKDYLTSKQAARVLAGIDRTSLKGLRDYAIISLMVTTGLRTVSIIRANICDLRAAGDAMALYYQGKGHEEKGEYVKIAEPVEAAISAYLEARGEKNPNAALFAPASNRDAGEHMTTKSISRLVKEAFGDVGLVSDRLTAHSLRHTAATQNLLNGGSIEETRQLLGHKNINTTLIYSHALERANNNSESRIASAIFG